MELEATRAASAASATDAAAAAGAHDDSYSRRGTRRERERGEAGGRGAGCERVQMDAIGPTPCSDCISATNTKAGPELLRRRVVRSETRGRRRRENGDRARDM